MNLGQALAQRVTRDDQWVMTNSYGVPVWIAYNDVPHPPLVDHRHVFILMEAEHFTPDKLNALFKNVAAVYKDPVWLDITAFSDKQMLQRAINYSTSGVSIDWVDSPEGREAARKFAEEHYPLPTGYYRASYLRISRNQYSQTYTDEQYSYSPDPAKAAMVTVVLQGKPASPYSGDLKGDLEIAIREHDLQKVRSLIDKGASVNSRYEDDETPIMIAVMGDRDGEIVKLLLAKNADVNAKDNRSDTALINASSGGRADIVNVLLDKGADINHQNRDGYSALIMAATSPNRLQCLKALLGRGADVNARDVEGNTALLEAAANCAAEMVSALLKKGARADATNNNGETALLLAARPGKSLETVRLLLENGADVNGRSHDGDTPLIVASSMETVELLISKGADVNSKNREGLTALMRAAQFQETEKARVLLEHGADVGAKNNEGATAFSLADRYGANNALLDLLEEAESKEATLKEIDHRPPLSSNGPPQLTIKRDPNAGCCDEISSVAFRPDGKLLASKLYHSKFGGGDGIMLWDLSRCELMKSVEGPRNGVISITFSPDGRLISSEFGEAWSIDTGQKVTRPGTGNDSPAANPVYSFATTPHSTVAAFSGRKTGERNKITIFDSASGAPIRSFTTDTEVEHLRFGPNGRTLAGVVRGAKNTILIWDTASGEIIREIETAGPAFYDLVYSEDGKWLAASAGDIVKDSSVTVFDAHTGGTINNLNGYSTTVFSVEFSRGGTLLATGGTDATVRLWDPATGVLLRIMRGHKHFVRSVVFSPDGRLLASGGAKNEAKIWSLSTGELLVTLAAFNDGNWIAYTPDGYYSCSEGAAKYVSWQIGNQSYDEAKYREQYFKPEIVSARLR